MLGEFGRVEYLELGADDGHVDGEHVGGFGAGVQDAGVFAIGLEVADGGRETFGGCLGREVQPDAGLGASAAAPAQPGAPAGYSDQAAAQKPSEPQDTQKAQEKSK